MALLPQIKEMLAAGKTQKQVEAELGLSGYRPVHELLKRERKKELQGVPKARGRKPAKTLQEYKYENKRLKMENELLRDFLQSTEREWDQRQSTMSYTDTGKNTQYPWCVKYLKYPGADTMISSVA